jgi:hypothetical protein
MPRWTFDRPGTVELGELTSLRVRLVGGSVAVLTAPGPARLDVARLGGPPLLVTEEAGVLTIGYEDLRWEWPKGLDSLAGWLRPQRRRAEITVTVPPECGVQLGVVSASTTICDVSAGICALSLSGGLSLDGVAGAVDIKTVSGDLEARGVSGELAFNSISGSFTVAGGHLAKLDAKTVTGPVTADLDPDGDASLRVATVSGEVAIRLPADPDVRVALRSGSGSLHAAFPGLRSTDGPPASLAGTLGGGAAGLSVNTMSGAVTLLSRPSPARTAQPDAGKPAAAGADAQGGAR